MKDTPPSCASAMARSLPETACMMAETIGIFMVMADVSPFLKRTSGVSRFTLSGMHSAEE